MTPKEYLEKVAKLDTLQKQYLENIGLLLLSIRGDWGNAESVKTRAKAALCLVDLIKKNCLFTSCEFHIVGREYMRQLKKSITEYIDDFDNEPDGFDGRYFRDNFPGGYMGICPSDFGNLEEV